MLLKEIFKFSNGKATKLFTIGNNPVYGSTGIIRYTDKVLISGENTLIARVGSCGYCQYVTGQYWVSDNTIIATTKNGFIPKYGFYLLLMQNLQRLRIGTTQPLLTISILNSIDVKVHSFSEQQHIVNTIPFLLLKSF